jgi:hypothetical protein
MNSSQYTATRSSGGAGRKWPREAKVATRSVPPPTDMEIDHGVPVFLDQLIDAPAPRPDFKP